MKSNGLPALLVFVVACAEKPSAMTVCQKLARDDIVANCRAEQPGGLGVRAHERVMFDLPSVPGKGGQVLSFKNYEDFKNTVMAFGAAEALVGRHRYGSQELLVFVQMNSETPQEIGDMAKARIAALE